MNYLGYAVGGVLMAALLVVGGGIGLIIGWAFWILGSILFDILSWMIGG